MSLLNNMRNKITQKQAIFYQLYKNKISKPDEFIPIWQLIGEVYADEIGLWGFISYEVSARMSELWNKNPLLFERKQVVGKSGAKYFSYRIRHGVTPNDIIDSDLKTFYWRIKRVIEHRKLVAEKNI